MRKGAKAEQKVAEMLSGVRDLLSGSGGRLDVFTDDMEVEVKEIGTNSRGIYLSRKLLDKVSIRAHLRGKKGVVAVVVRNAPPQRDAVWLVIPLHVDVQALKKHTAEEEIPMDASEEEVRAILWRRLHVLARKLFGSREMRDGSEVVPAYIYYTRLYARKCFGVPYRRYLSTAQLKAICDWLQRELLR